MPNLIELICFIIISCFAYRMYLWENCVNESKKFCINSVALAVVKARIHGREMSRCQKQSHHFGPYLMTQSPNSKYAL